MGINYVQRIRDNGGTITRNEGVELTIVCAAGHTFDTYKSNVSRGTWCPHCPRPGRAAPPAFTVGEVVARVRDAQYATRDGKARFAEYLAERGYDLVEYTPSNASRTVRIPRQSEEEVYHSTFITYPKTVGEGRYRTVWEFRKGLRVFYQVGDTPLFLPEVLRDHVKGAERKDLGTITTRVATDTMREILQTETSDEVMNVLFNPQWISPGVFTWGIGKPYAGTLRTTK